jgi:hypothetical protein
VTGVRLLPAGGAAVMILAVPVSADSTPPPGIKPIPVITVIEAAEPFPDCVFLECHVTTSTLSEQEYRWNTTLRKAEADKPRPFSPLAEIDLAPGRPARFQGGRGTQYEVYAVPRAALGRFPDREELFAALRTQAVPGTGWHLCQASEGVRFGDPRSDVVLRYRVDRTPAGDGVVFTPLGEDRSGAYDQDAETRARVSKFRWAVAGVAAAVALAGFGLWFARRPRPNTARPTQPPAPSP